MKKYYILFLYLFFTQGYHVLCQSPTAKVVSNIPKRVPSLPQALSAKLKQSYIQYFENETWLRDKLAATKIDSKIISLKKIFPFAANDTIPYDKFGRKKINLAAWISITYLGNEEKFKSWLWSTGIFENVESDFTAIKAKPLHYPNDPYADSLNFVDRYGNDSAGGAWHLKKIKAFQAWDIHKGDSNTVTAAIDFGFNLQHEDLKNSIKVNINDPVNGLDDDNNGFVDDVQGWDFEGNDNSMNNSCSMHGSVVAAILAATPNNNKGFTGTGYYCKLMPLNIQSAPNCAVPDAVSPIVYAADNGARVLNMSLDYGGNFQVVQDLINYAVINKDVVVVAAAGNSGTSGIVYPASHDNVLSVGFTTFTDCKAPMSNYNYWVDMTAPGTYIFSVQGNGYGAPMIHSGSSFSAPMVAGAAALIRSRFPKLNAQQVMEKLRVTTQKIPSITSVCGANHVLNFKEKLGTGILDMYKAITDTSTPAARYESSRMKAGDTIALYLKLRNYLHPTDDLVVTIRSMNNALVSVVDSIADFGKIETMALGENEVPFRVILTSATSQNMDVLFRIGFQDSSLGYSDYQYTKIKFDRSYLNLAVNKIKLSITSHGRLGYTDFNRTVGEGMYYIGSPYNPLLFESGVMIATANNKVISNVINNSGSGADSDFKTILPVHESDVRLGDQYISSKYSDSSAGSYKIGLEITQKNYAYADTANNRFTIHEYDIKNTSGATIDSLFVGLFNQWSLGDEPNRNIASWDCESNTGYVYDSKFKNTYIGVKLLTNQSPGYFAMNNNSSITGNINPLDGFTKEEKFQSLSGGVARTYAGSVAGYSLSNISNVVSGMIGQIHAEKSRKIAFAYLVADNLAQLQRIARVAQNNYEKLNTGPVPDLDTVWACNSDTANQLIITPPNGQNFNFYTSLPGCGIRPICSGRSCIIDKVPLPTTIYISNIDSAAESDVQRVVVAKAHISANFSVSGLFITNDTIAINASIIPENASFGWSINNLTIAGDKKLKWCTTLPGLYTLGLSATNKSCTIQKSYLLSIAGHYFDIVSENIPVDTLYFGCTPGLKSLNVVSNGPWHLVYDTSNLYFNPLEEDSLMSIPDGLPFAFGPVLSGTGNEKIVVRSGPCPSDTSFTISFDAIGLHISKSIYLHIHSDKTQIKTKQEDPIIIFPNPTTDYLTIGRSSGISHAQVKLYNILGIEQLISPQSISPENIYFSVAQLPLGIYILDIAVNDIHHSQKIFIIR